LLELAHLKEFKGHKGKKTTIDSTTHLNVTIANNLDTWPKNAPRNRLQRNAMAAKSLVILPEIALKETRRTLQNATNATKMVTLPNNAKVRVFLFLD